MGGRSKLENSRKRAYPFAYRNRLCPGAVFSLKFAASAVLDKSPDWGNTQSCPAH